ncbi:MULTISPECIES: cupin domain-containing protein [Cyanophyceae]|uniref:cupin domain-containing protein n=1 Tax=Cyanophyceae TaxID=3028117 RepID=UPI001687CB3C|nr:MULTISPECIES: cupin domain-containing protein [Cyanophyceae]MBD1917938.1 cupin domain-containing protein [Phormidium sp. FACHB-77]MBD2029186.1 cupin domain-containing protein [Phormidium sp. FACHB-322]MBD2049718.1 cupin domain-containing protein [Leptolyngbya sp. FACHB-60]
MSEPQKPIAISAAEAPLRTRPSLYPEPFVSKMAGREKRSLGSIFGLSNFGINHVTLAPGGVSALRHAHATQDEFVYIISGQPTLVTNAGETLLQPGMCAGFKAGDGDAHCLVNQTSEDVVYLEMGDRSSNDRVSYPDDDIQSVLTPGGQWQFNHKDGAPY